MNDSVREELKDKISIAPKPVKLEVKPNPPVEAKTNPPLVKQAALPTVQKPQLQPSPIAKPVIPAMTPAPAPAPVKTQTSEITAKPTSPTLVEFQNKNASLPDWRLQLQNAVRKRVETGNKPLSPEVVTPAAPRVHLPTSGANALKAQVVEEKAPEANRNPKLENALRRIEESRRQFLTEEISEISAAKPQAASVAPNKNFPFYIASKNAEVMPKPPEVKTPASFPPKAKVEDLPIIEKSGLDTNKLKPLPNALVIPSSLEKAPEVEHSEEIKDAPIIKISRVKTELDEAEDLDFEHIEVTEEEIEDVAPFAMRFNAGLFDLIIGSFTAALLLSPLMLSGGNWFSLAGLLAFLVTASIVMFIYLTTAIGFFGKTFGMKLFSLETIDIEENDYPTLHQAAVSSSVYLVSLALGGIGFLPALFNSEKRAAHDLLSGTIIVREY